MISLVSPLFVPGDHPDSFQEAVDCGTDSIVFDLQDSCAPENKARARQNIVSFIEEYSSGQSSDIIAAHKPVLIGVRINGVNSQEYPKDLEALQAVSDQLDFVMQPLVNESKAMTETKQLLKDSDGAPVPIVALVETARGIVNAAEIASTRGVAQLAFGAGDYSEQLRVNHSNRDALLFARSTLATASVAFRLSPPVDTPYFNVANEDGLVDATHYASALGFSGKLCIHPSQCKIVTAAFKPSDSVIAWAREAVEKFEEAVARKESSVELESGNYVDAPIYRRALDLLAKAGKQ